MKGKLKTGDIVIAAGVLLLALSIFLFSAFVVFSDAGNIVRLSCEEGEFSFPLYESTEYSFESRGYSLTLCIEKGSAFVSFSDCPDKTCVNSGRISRSGQMIACVPAGVTIRVSEKENAYDFIAG